MFQKAGNLRFSTLWFFNKYQIGRFDIRFISKSKSHESSFGFDRGLLQGYLVLFP